MLQTLDKDFLLAIAANCGEAELHDIKAIENCCFKTKKKKKNPVMTVNSKCLIYVY